MRRTLLVAAIVVVASAPVSAGPLDRQGGDLDSRSNPAANNMLRVPGVIGASVQDATQLLQQAGLNPRTQIMKRADVKYSGQEGLVIGQTPLPGGVAMLGSSVIIVVYQPLASPVSQSGGVPQPPSDNSDAAASSGDDSATPMSAGGGQPENSAASQPDVVDWSKGVKWHSP